MEFALVYSLLNLISYLSIGLLLYLFLTLQESYCVNLLFALLIFLTMLTFPVNPSFPCFNVT